MRAVILSPEGLGFEANCQPEPPAGEREVAVRVLRAGICETDLQLVQGYMGFTGVLGHEFVGVAESGRFAGQRVAGEINCACGECPLCRDGLPNHCPRRTVLGILNRNGAFADRLWLPEENLHPIPETVSDEEAVFVETLAAAFQIPAQLDLSLFGKAVVLGDGRLGNLCAQVLAASGSAPLMIGKHQEKLDRLKSRGIETALLEEVTERRFADLVVECTGSPTGFPTACELVRPRGTVVLKTTVAGENGPNLAPVVIDEITVLGSRCGPFPDAIRALADGTVEVAPLITSRFRLESAVEAFRCAARKDQLKVLLEI